MLLKRLLIFFTILLLLLGSCLVLFISFLLPSYLESRLLPKIAASAGAERLSAEIRRIGATGIDIEEVSFGTRQSPFLTAGSLKVDYSIRGLLNHHLDRISIQGINIDCSFNDGRLTFAGITLPGSTGREVRQPLQLPISFDRIAIRNSQFNLLINSHRLTFPFHLTVEQPSPQSMRGTLVLIPRDQQIELSFSVDLAANRGQMTITGKTLAMEQFQELITLPAALNNLSPDLDANVIFSLSPLKTNSFSASLKSGHRRDASFSSGHTISSSPLTVDIRGDLEKIHLDLNNLRLVTTVIDCDAGAEIDMHITEQAIDASGKISATLIPHGDITTVPDNSTIDIIAPFTASRLTDGSWRLDLDELQLPATTGLRNNDIRFFINKAAAGLSAKGNSRAASIQYYLSSPQITAARNNQPMISAGFSLAGQTDLYSGEHIFEKMQGNLTARLDETILSVDDNVIKGDISATANYETAGNSPLTMDLIAQINNGSITMSKQDIIITGITGKIPFAWPLQRSSAEEKTTASILWRGKDAGDLDLAIAQNSGAIKINGSHNNKLLPGLKIALQGEYELPGPGRAEHFSLLLELPEYHARSIDLSGIIDLPELVFFDGRINGTASFSGTADRPAGALELHLDRGLVEIPSRDLTIDGISTSLFLPDLMTFRSAPAQPLHFESLTAGSISTASGAVSYQLEPPDLIFIEKASVQWGNGQINTYNLRLSGTKQDYDINLYAEQISLGKILEQFGLAYSGGEGSVNGRIAMRLDGDKINIRDSFLYSTPGQGGFIKLSGTDMITQGLPVGSPGYSQLDFAAEALREFRYEWVKLHFINEDENLVMKMEMDGKPGRRLPFRYDSSRNTFLRVREQESGAGIFQPIRLDVNFRLPLNTILEYKKEIDNIIDSFQ